MDKKQEKTICNKFGIKPFTKDNVLNYYFPIHGVISYGVLAVDVMNPSLVPKLLPKKALTNVLLLSTLCGTSLYVYGRPHLQKLPGSRRLQYALLGGSLFSMGSVLAWAVIKSLLPEQNALVATLAGLGTGAVILKISTDYFNDCDKLNAAK